MASPREKATEPPSVVERAHVPQPPATSSDDHHVIQGAGQAPHTLSARNVLALQHTVGNRSTAGLVVARRGVRGTAPQTALEKMEAAFGQDFSGVRLHTESAEPGRLGAKSFTRGEEIHFSPGAYQPGSATGERLLGHELAHVAQQRSGQVRPTGKVAGQPVNDAPALEHDAEESGARAARGQQVATSTPGRGAQGEPVQQHFFELAWVLSAAGTLGFGVTAILGLIGVFGIAAVGYALKQCLSAGEEDVDLDQLKARIVSIKETGVDDKQSGVEKPDESAGTTGPDVDATAVKSASGEIPKMAVEEVKSEVKDVKVEDAPTDVPTAATKSVDPQPQPEIQSQLPKVGDGEVTKVETTVAVDEPKVTESKQAVAPRGRKKQKHPPRRRNQKKERDYSSAGEVESTPVDTGPTLSRLLSNKLKSAHAGHEPSDVASWQKRGRLSDDDVMAVLGLSSTDLEKAIGMDASLFGGIAKAPEGAQEWFEQAKVGAFNQRASEEAKNKPKEREKHPTVKELELAGVSPDDATTLFQQEGAEKINAWLTTHNGQPQYVMRAADVCIKTKKSLADIDALVVAGNPNLYPQVTVLNLVMSHGFEKVAAALQDTANEDDVHYLENWLGYELTNLSTIQLKRLVRFQARLRRNAANLAVYQADTEYLGSYDPPSRTGFLRYNFGPGERIVIHTHWNVHARKLVSMHVQDNSQNGMELHTWKWFDDVAAEVRDAHNRATGNMAPTGGKLSLA